METIVGEIIDCADCGTVGFVPSSAVHAAADRRRRIVSDSALEMNRRGVDYQPGQTWTAKHTARRRSSRSRS